jgi:N-formylglutamate amidohydrolase
VDVNREPYELDPKMFADPLPNHVNVKSLRVAGGLGTIARIVGERQEIYADLLPSSEAFYRIEHYYKPYHKMLCKLLAKTYAIFGYAVLIDCHSMPSSIRTQDGMKRPDFILGDRFGSSCQPMLSEAFAKALRSYGYTVTRNKPYAGGFITEHYGRPHKGIHAIQLEINRGLYLNEAKLQKTAGFDTVSTHLKEAFSILMDVAPDTLYGRTAAE